MTTTKSQTYDSVPVTDSFPQHDAICTSALSADLIQCNQSVFSCLSTNQLETRRATVLSLIREIVSYPGFDTYSVSPIVNSCATALPAAEFSDLLQQPNIEGHTALYWPIINNRRDVLWAFNKFISQHSLLGFADLRLACMAVNDHDLFMRMGLGDDVNPKDKSLRRMLGCPRDEIKVFHRGLSESDSPLNYYKVDELDSNHFIASFSFKMFQKRLRITRNLAAEFVARGRIWVLRIYMGPEGKWCISYGLSEHSSPPVHSDAMFAIRAHRKLPELSRAPHQIIKIIHLSATLVPEDCWLSHECYAGIEPDKGAIAIVYQLDSDWLVDELRWHPNDGSKDDDKIALPSHHEVFCVRCKGGLEEEDSDDDMEV